MFEIISRQDAVRAVHDQAAVDANGNQVIHCVYGLTGETWQLPDVIDTIRRADRVAWVQDPLGHNLAVRDHRGDVYHFYAAP